MHRPITNLEQVTADWLTGVLRQQGSLPFP